MASAQGKLVHRAILDCPKYMNLCLFFLDISFVLLVIYINARPTLALLLTKPTKQILIGMAVGSGFTSRLLRQSIPKAVSFTLNAERDPPPPATIPTHPLISMERDTTLLTVCSQHQVVG